MEIIESLKAVILGGVSGQFGQGAIVLWALGVMTYVLRTVPRTLWLLASRQLTTTVIINNSGDYPESLYYQTFLTWFNANRKWANKSRSLSVAKADDDLFDEYNKVGFSAGVGTHYFVHGRRLYLLRIREMESNGTERVKLSMTLTGFFRSRDKINDLFKSIGDLAGNRGIEYRTLEVSGSSTGMYYSGKIVPRTFDQISIDKELVSTLRDRITWFVNNREWYHDRGIPYKLAILLHGPSGTGKSSIVRAIASEYRKDIITANLDSAPSSASIGIVDRIEKDILLFEDFEECDFVKPQQGTSSDKSSFNISSFLNLLDGCSNHDGSIIIMTTNHLDKIDERIYRGGRCDLVLSVGPLDEELVNEYFHRQYPEYRGTGYIKTTRLIKGCELHDISMINVNDPEGFIQSASAIR